MIQSMTDLQIYGARCFILGVAVSFLIMYLKKKYIYLHKEWTKWD